MRYPRATTGTHAPKSKAAPHAAKPREAPLLPWKSWAKWGQLSTLLLFLAPTAFAASSLSPKPIILLEPLPGPSGGSVSSLTVCPSDPFFLINQYLQPTMAWGAGIAAGLAVLMIVVGGLQMMFSGGAPEGMASGKQRIISAIFGLIFIVFSAALLNFLNAYFYTLGGVPPVTTC